VVNLGSIIVFTILSSFLSTTTKNIENSFLQNSPQILYSLFSHKSHVNISFPEPISFSDQLTNQQAYFLFQKIFSTYTTFEFYSESDIPLFIERERYIFKARWSFRNKKNNDLFVFHIFFYLKQAEFQEIRASPNLSKINSVKEIWKITEIRAEKF